MNTNASETNGVVCRLVVDGRVIEFTLDGPLVALAPAAEKTAKRTRRGAK